MSVSAHPEHRKDVAVQLGQRHESGSKGLSPQEGFLPSGCVGSLIELGLCVSCFNKGYDDLCTSSSSLGRCHALKHSPVKQSVSKAKPTATNILTSSWLIQATWEELLPCR
ncbi:hypothetical protein PGT21_022921 [Puccinia graminis f. sp. tritici]|uniref:Uncharacterized protein n=1 Tax=Puccinia graminis f. sp. tritici TaxID=56615 RepID=A0A5B0MY72_PUCGR|nr:hypothetical protein PGTUg99_002848 [Puccinia graminis f. sp. tritici]KAA1074809.1 hypothetical protein PGT21_021549 [Puccinia graminis f. sp. tritici]KAA1080829.1 hypothetical protein PGT21_022921 [Puccinia graminis f. sp. tritici]KAA1116720.1 hypothetical protein PGTUg99_002703 [Puccinia graminis f. sp. tritici]